MTPNQAGKFSSVFTTAQESLANNAYLRAIQRGMLFALPLIFIGAISLCMLNFPSVYLQDFFTLVFGDSWRTILEKLVLGAFGIASPALVFTISYSIAQFENTTGKNEYISPAMNIMVVLSCYIIIIGPPSAWKSTFSLNHGLFLAATTPILVSFIFFRIASWKNTRLSLSFIGRDPTTFQVLTLLPAATLTIFLFAVARVVYENMFPTGIDPSRLFISLFYRDDICGLGLGMWYVAISQVLWFFGIHGPNMLISIEQGTLSVAMLENIQAALIHAPPPHIMTKGFLDAFAYIGGSGSTLSLIIAILLKSRDLGNRRLCLFALFPALCNVNEPMLFGIPLVFNPLYIIPFLLTPLLDIIAAYTATVFELVPRTTANVHWTIPPLLSGYISTGSIAGTLMQLVNLSLGVVVYLPFVLLADKIHMRQMQGSLKNLERFAEDALPGPDGKKCISRPGVEGFLARVLAEDLKKALKLEEQLFMVYQPQVNTLTNRVEGVESLLRWKHPTYGHIPPPLTVALAEDSGVIDALGIFVIRSACQCFLEWRHTLDKNFLMSVNLSTKQFDNPNLADDIHSILISTGNPARNLEVEITESVAMTTDDTTYDTLAKLQSLGIKVAIDDFGMGHTSLRYIKDFPIDTVKLDKSLTENTESGVNDHIVRSLIYLSENLKLRTIVEGVEQCDQCRHFNTLGCFIFQGFYFSKPLMRDDCFKFIVSYGTNGGYTVDKDILLKKFLPAEPMQTAKDRL